MEKIITRSQRPTLANRRVLGRVLEKRPLDQALHRTDAVRRPGGYTRIVKLGARRSDSARMAIIELV